MIEIAFFVDGIFYFVGYGPSVFKEFTCHGRGEGVLIHICVGESEAVYFLVARHVALDRGIFINVILQNSGFE